MKDLAELYTRISMGLLFGMFPIVLISEYFNSLIGIPVILGFIITGVYLMFKRIKLERQNIGDVK